jgi:hypothetical protein
MRNPLMNGRDFLYNDRLWNRPTLPRGIALMNFAERSAMNSFKCLLLILIFALASTLGGCAVGDFTAGPAPLDNTVDPAFVQQHSRAGYVYCMRGWLGIFSTGMMTLSDRLNTQVGVTSMSVADMEYSKLQDWLVAQYKQGKMNEPLVLLGHSWGADDMIRVSKKLQENGITVDLLVLIDPVTPPAVTPNVKRVYCVYKSHPATDWYPAWRGVAATVEDPAATSLVNIDLRTAPNLGFDTTEISHPYIDKFEGVHDMAIKEIEKVCPPRAVWTQSHPSKPGLGRVTPTTLPTVGAARVLVP